MTHLVPCKINLGLRVLGRRPDGYHNLESIFIPLPFLHDDLEITSLAGLESETRLTLTGIPIPLPDKCQAGHQDNLCLRAYEILKADFPDLPAVHIRLHKRIPTGAGLGGGSSDAAFTLKGLNALFSLGLDEAALERYAARLGADCAFFIRCVPAFVEGIGDRLTPLDHNPIEGYRVLLAKPPEAVNTREAYAGIDEMKAQGPIESMKLIESIESIEKKDPIPSISSISSINSISSIKPPFTSHLSNDFEAAVFPRHPAIAALKADLYALGADYASMSGSGAVVYGLFEDAATLRAAAQRLRHSHPDYFISPDLD